MIEKEFIPYDEALALKGFGFDEPCFGFYTEECKALIKNFCKYPINLPTKPFLAPIFSQAFRWFREKYGLKHDIDDDNVGTKYYYRVKSYTDMFSNYDDIIKLIREEKDWDKIEFKTYEETELACLQKLIEIIKNK